MSGQFRTMLDLEGDIQYRFSVAGVESRHSPGAAGRIRQLINVSIAQYRHLVAGCFTGIGLTAGNPATFASVSATSPAVTGETYAEIDWPVDAVGVYGVRVQLAANGRWYPLKRIPFAAYQDYQYAHLLNFSGAQQRGPIGYTARELPRDAAGNGTEGVGKVMITPVPTGGSFRLWYLRAWEPLTADGAKVFAMADGHEWIIVNTCLKMLQPDHDSPEQRTLWTDERKMLRAQIIEEALRLDEGPLEPRDARGDGYDFDPGGEL